MTRCDLSPPRCRCPVCGFVARRRNGTLVPNAIRTCPGWRWVPRMPLGDWTARILRAIGVTESRVSGWLGQPCGCGGRKQRWNAAGTRLGDWLDSRVASLLRRR